MKNITVSLSAEAYRRARVVAASRDTSVSALVRRFLESLDAQTDFDRRVQLERDTRASIKNFNGGDRLTRDEIHDRRALR